MLIWAILRPIGQALFNIFGYPIYQIWLLIKTPILFLLSFLKFVIFLGSILTIPFANYAVYKSKRATDKQKMKYVSLVTILLGFLMVVLELQRIRNPLGLSEQIDAKYQRNHELKKLALDNFDPVEGFEKYQDWPFCVTQYDMIVNLQRLLQRKGNRIVYQMPD